MEQRKVAADLCRVHSLPRHRSAFVDLLGGQTQIMFPGRGGRRSRTKPEGGRCRAVTGSNATLPPDADVRRSGYPGFDGVSAGSLVSPTCGTDRSDSTTKSTSCCRISFAERLSAEALQPMPMIPDAFGRHIRDDIALDEKPGNALGSTIDTHKGSL
jgi:hypothetical protein